MLPASKEALYLVLGENSTAGGVTQLSLSSGEALLALSPSLIFSHNTTSLPPVLSLSPQTAC